LSEDHPEYARRSLPPGQEQRGFGDVINNAEHLATIYGIYKATHPSKPQDPPKDK
jgi:hypothetical protein